MSLQVINKLVWIDLEMTGLDLRKDKIIQIAVLITDTDLNILDENGYVAYANINQDDVDNMVDIVRDMHTKNGVIEKCLSSELSIEDLDRGAVEYISKFVSPKESPLCGSSIATDRMFIEYNMPLLRDFLHYRNIDVSTVKQLTTMWLGELHSKEVDTHDALDDIKESIKELQFYKEKVFKK
jgi:oligoribonuclease